MLFNLNKLYSWIPAWPNFKIIPTKTAPILPPHVFTNGVSRSLPPAPLEKPHYLPQADQNAKKVLQKMMDNGLVRDLTDEAFEMVSENEKGRELFLQYHYRNMRIVSSMITSFESLGLEEAKNQLMTLAYLMKYEKPDTKPGEDEIAKRVFLIEPSLPNEEKVFLREQIISAYGTDKTVFVDFEETSLQEGAKFSAVLLDEDLKNAFSTRTFTQEELPSISGEYRIEKPSKVDRHPERMMESFFKEILGSQAGKSEVDIKTFTIDLTELAEKGLISPAYGREEEIQSIFDDLGGKKLSSVLLTGPTGCGKTQIAREIARRIHEGKAPDNMKGRRVLFVDTSRLLANTPYRGMMEGKIQTLVDYAKKHANEVLIVFDEISQTSDSHSSQETTIADLLLTHIDEANFPMVAMTTELKFERLVKSAPDFVRRFQLQKIDRMTPKLALEVLKLDKKRLEASYCKHEAPFSITSEALEAIVYLSFKFVKHEGLPSSAYKLLDTICNRASREGITEVTPEVVINRLAKIEKLSAEDVTLELERLKNDPHLTLIDQASLLHKYGKRIAPSTKTSIDRTETNVVTKALHSDEYTAVFVTGQPRVGKTTLIHQVFKQFPSRATLTIDLNEIYQDIQDRKVQLSEVVEEITDKAEQLILFFQGTQLATKFGSIFLDRIEEKVECGKLFLVVEMRENVEIPPLWKNRCPIVDVPRLAEITQAKTAHQWKNRAQPEPSSWSALFFRKISVLTSCLEALFHRIARHFPW